MRVAIRDSCRKRVGLHRDGHLHAPVQRACRGIPPEAAPPLVWRRLPRGCVHCDAGRLIDQPDAGLGRRRHARHAVRLGLQRRRVAERGALRRRALRRAVRKPHGARVPHRRAPRRRVCSARRTAVRVRAAGRTARRVHWHLVRVRPVDVRRRGNGQHNAGVDARRHAPADLRSVCRLGRRVLGVAAGSRRHIGRVRRRRVFAKPDFVYHVGAADGAPRGAVCIARASRRLRLCGRPGAHVCLRRPVVSEVDVGGQRAAR
mmetsp:Transcript_14489/g.42229  ORF Transcript_14489/g.42229 Transcript_14489/m.42229 type:complete len:260 (-) Transcript_14489:6134-6913(-)